MSLILALIYPVAIQYRRGGAWLALTPFAVVAITLSAVVNHTEMALLFWEFPRKGENTLSVRLARLQLDTGWRGKIARPIARYTDYFDPTGKHV